MTFDVMKYEIMIFEFNTYDVMTFDVMKYAIMTCAMKIRHILFCSAVHNSNFGLGWAVPHSDFLIDPKNIDTQKIFVGSNLL